ncbi:MAG: hypothetical protein ACJ8EL_20800 [Rhizomicrobium sp.]|jgi:hypothetical protein
MSEASATAFVAQQAGRFREIALRNFSLSKPVWETLAVVALCPVLLSAAIWNGFPLIFYDTGAYMLQSFGHKFVPERSPVFSIFLLVAGGDVSLWLVALVQTLMASFVMVETARAVAPRITLPILLAIGAVLTLLTGLPWYAGQIEPDIFTPLVVLCLYLLAFHPTRLGKARCAALVIIAALSTAMHPSHLGLGVELALLLVGYRLFVALRRKPWPSIDITRPISAALLGLSLVLAGNYIYTGRMFVSRAGPVFMFARMLQDGVVQRLLNETCPTSNYMLCRYRSTLPHRADKWLWGPGSLFVKLHRFIGTEKESAKIVHDSLVRYPAWNAELAARDALQQFTLFYTGDQIEPQQWILFWDFHKFIPDQLRAYDDARQQKGELHFRPINYIHMPVGGIILLMLIAGLVLAIRRRDLAAAPLLGFILAALIGNAIICGVFSNPHARYQSRLIWVPAFALALLAVDRRTAALRPS